MQINRVHYFGLKISINVNEMGLRISNNEIKIQDKKESDLLIALFFFILFFLLLS
tara:strand:+ start:6500 stop:6664 length:165 start_codon:yes stop_codon:yes gene_type:complete